MKLQRIIPTLALISLLAFASGCDKKDPSTAANDSTNGTQSTMANAAVSVKETAEAAATSVKETAVKVTTEVKQAAETTTTVVATKVDAMKAEAQTLIDKAKSLVTDKKYEDALNSLKELSNLSLSPEQQKTVDD